MRSAALRQPDLLDETPESLLAAIRSALEDDTVAEARRLAEQGAFLFPDSEELQRAHHVLRPPVVRTAVGAGKVPDRREAFEWLRANGQNYQGRWIAFDNQGLVASADRLADLIRTVDALELPVPPILHFIA